MDIRVSLPGCDHLAKMGVREEVNMIHILAYSPKTHEQRDNHRPGCWITNVVTVH